MKQIFQSLKTGESLLIEVPVPDLKANQVLIKTEFSLVSAGTERMLVEFGKSNYIEKAKQQTYKVKTKTLTDILKENNAPKFIEYLSIDVEGSEPNVLRGIDFSEYTFCYISIEFNHSLCMKNIIDYIQNIFILYFV